MLFFLTETLIQIKILNVLIVLFLFYVFSFSTICFWRSNSNFIIKKFIYEASQKVHIGDVPRMGGLIIYVCLWFCTILNNYIILQNILICTLPTMLIIVKEDLFNNVSYQIRLFGLTLSAICLILFSVINFPEINNLPFISSFFQYKSFNIIFFTVCIIVLANGFNFIDGMNGLLIFYLLGAIVSCLFLCFIVGDIVNAKLLLIYALFCFAFLTINYPWGKIFLGDSGAYLLGMIIGVWVINFFAVNSTISSWNAALIFFYPSIEVLYSIIRKLSQKKSPFLPDHEHLHLKIFELLDLKYSNAKISNNLTTLSLAIFWLVPPLFLPLVYDCQILIILMLAIFTIIYLVISFMIPFQRIKDKL
ncbi:undecaprenyl/decaprenyl-phosphate alpha-N-acetylglucosaminyl 1-phosphate transferase [Methylophilaceae bacterium]|nr:undecaprenyl/decaprenyl-phosphate alpha-N-acetylglucosaminyl 1-phosphate transferase [Methylophilaceae bacterium]